MENTNDHLPIACQKDIIDTQYPTNKAAAYTILNKYQPDKKNQPEQRNEPDHKNSKGTEDNNRDTPADVISVYQRATPTVGDPIPGTEGNVDNNINFYRCGRPGHQSNTCPTPRVDGFQGMQYCFSQDNNIININGFAK